jgi:hypothetical protein
MQKNLLRVLVVGVLLLAGCSSTVHTIVAKDGKVTLTDTRGGKVVGTWELKQVLTREEKNALRRDGWKYEAFIHNLSGPDTYLLKRRVTLPTAAEIAAARPAFHPLLITTFGTNASSDGSWRIGVSENTLDVGRVVGLDGNDATPLSNWTSTISPGEWKAKTGWFVFIENKSNVWAYDGDRQLLLQVETMNENNLGGSTYPGGYPCAVPDEVFSRLSERKQKDLQASK